MATKRPLAPPPKSELNWSLSQTANEKMSVKGFVDSFVDSSSSEASRQQSLDSICGLKCSIGEVVEALESALVNPSGATRARGVLLLAQLLNVWALERLNSDELGFLMVFFRDRSRDNPCVSEVIAGLIALFRWSEKIDTSSFEAMLVTIFAEVFVQGLDQPARNSVFRLMELVVTKTPLAAVALGHDFVFGYLQMIDGERDPRNLLVIFSLTPKVLQTVTGWERLAEELFDVCACYYPINYKPRGENDPITPSMLADALDKVMTCCPQFAQFYYTFMTEKLEGGDRGHLWTSLSRSIRAFADGGMSFLPHAFVFWGAIQEDAFEGRDAETVQRSCKAVTDLLSALSENLVTQSSGACSLDPLLEPLLRVCSAKLQSGGADKDALVAGALLTAAARSSAECSRRVCAMAVPVLSRLVTGSSSSESVAGLLRDLVSAACDSGRELPKKAHPLFAHIEGLQAVALELCQHPSSHSLRQSGLLLLSELCFRTPLAAVEAQGVAFARVLEQGPDHTLAAVVGMTLAMQKELALPRLLSADLSDAALGGLCGLRPEIVLPEPTDALFSNLLSKKDSQLAAAVLGNFANKGQATKQLATWLRPSSSSSSLSSLQLAWIGRGLVLSGDVLAATVLNLVAARCENDEAEATLLLETIFGSGLEALSSTSHAIVRSLGRQKAFCLLFPKFVERENLHAVGVLSGVVAPAVLLGELPQLLPMLLGKVKSGGAGLQGALISLASVVKEAASDVALHTDTLLKQAASYCVDPDVGVRRAALFFLLACANSLPFPRLYGWREHILLQVALALDDSKRDIRKLAVLVSNKYNSLQ